MITHQTGNRGQDTGLALSLLFFTPLCLLSGALRTPRINRPEGNRRDGVQGGRRA